MLRILFLISFIFLTGLPAQASVPQLKEISTEDDIKSLLLANHSNPLISVSIAFKTGSLNDPEGKEGTAYMLSGLLNEGAGKLKATAFQQALKEKAIEFSADATQDMFYLKLQTPSAHKETAFSLLGMMLSDLRLDRDAINRVRSQILAIHNMEEESPKEIAYKSLRKELFPTSSLGNKVSGTPKSIASIRKKDLSFFLKNNFAKDNIFIGVSGDITAEELKVLLSKSLKDLPETSSSSPAKATSPAFSREVNKVAFPVPQSSIFFAMSGLNRNDKDFYSLYVLNHILGGSVLSSRLGKEIREKQGLVYGINTWLDINSYAPLWLGYAATGTENTAKVISLIQKEINDIAENGVTGAELSEAKTNLTGAFPLRFTSSSGMSDMLMVIQAYNLGNDYLNRRNGYISAVTSEDIKRVAKRLLQADKLSFTVVGEEKPVPSNIGESK